MSRGSGVLAAESVAFAAADALPSAAAAYCLVGLPCSMHAVAERALLQPSGQRPLHEPDRTASVPAQLLRSREPPATGFTGCRRKPPSSSDDGLATSDEPGWSVL